MSAATKAVSWLCLAVLLLLLFGDALDLIGYLRDPSAYGFGTEVAGFRYLSSTHFVGSIVLTIVGAAAALLAPKLISSPAVVLAVRAGLASVLIALRYT